MEEKRNERSEMNLGSMLVRILVSMVVLAVAAFFTPYFSIVGLVPLLLAAVAIGVIDYLIERVTGFDASPFGRGLTGFVVSALIIYLTGFLIAGVRVNLFGATLAALAIGVINMMIPGKRVL